MFFFLSKFLPLFIYPVGLTCILILVAIGLWKWRRWQTAVLLAAFLLLYLAATPLVAYNLTRSLERRYLPPDPVPQVDVILVLGGTTETAGYPQTTVGLNKAADRLWYAAWLYHQGVAPKLMLSGGKLPGTVETEAERMAEALRLLGVPDEAMIREGQSLNTYENALYSAPLLAEMEAELVLLVTSAMHMPRSVAIFEKMGIPVIPAPTDFEALDPAYAEGEGPEAWLYLFTVLPSVNELELTTRALKEVIGIWIYSWRGWL